MFTLHIANKNYSSWSLRPWVLMRTLNIPFEEQIHPLDAGGSWNSYRHFSPNGRVPCLQDGDQTVWDSLAIVEYIAETYPQVWPADKAARAWARSASAEMHSGFQTLRNTCGMSCGHRIQLHAISAGLERDIQRINELWNQGLQTFRGPFLAGAYFTAVDAFFAPVAFRFQTYGLPLTGPAQDYLTRLLNVPAMQDWYASGLKETWREPEHEQEILAAGKLLADLRNK
ncbi:glutathione S-transferase family protein [Cellvibrio sp. pealriver]|uniref:glutathione S-transferase family protein n=1 Tax=Cellvibrio sp. pealriver TaxID=1622269 RepID=UPI00066FD097|nr:glutathione S-transferase family protein [Cellvibrio sp. pealriver]